MSDSINKYKLQGVLGLKAFKVVLNVRLDVLWISFDQYTEMLHL